MELSEEVYYLDGSWEWTLSSQTTQHVETSLWQPLGALRSLTSSFKGDEILASAFERRDGPALRGPAAGGALRLPLEQVLSNFDTVCDRGWQERGITPEEIRNFCGSASGAATSRQTRRRALWLHVPCGALAPPLPVSLKSAVPEFGSWCEWDGKHV